MTERTTQSQVNGDVVEKNLPLPEVLQLILTAESIPDTEPTILQLDGQFCVVGDIHGNIQDLLRIIDIGGYPADTQHLFLGDYIDRGKNSSAVILLLYAQLKSISFEFSQMGRQYGFLAESGRYTLIEPYQRILTSSRKCRSPQSSETFSASMAGFHWHWTQKTTFCSLQSPAMDFRSSGRSA